MASAEELLNSVSEAAYSDSTAYCTVSNVSRVIFVPGMASILGVENDKGVKRVYFQMERWYCGVDLSEFDLRINYSNAKGEEGESTAWDVTTSSDGEFITFYWKVDQGVTKYAGAVKFIICARKLDSEDNVLQEFNTTIAGASVLAGLKMDDDTNPTLTAAERAIFSDADVLAYIESSEASFCSVDFYSRKINLGVSTPILGVENDKNVHVIPFRIPRHYEEFDLSAFDIRLNYENAAKVKKPGLTMTLSTTEDYIIFAWLVDFSVTEKAGAVRFALQLRQVDSGEKVVYELNTMAASAAVLPGLEPGKGDAAATSTSAILGIAVLGKMVLGNAEKLSKPAIKLVEVIVEQLDAPVIRLELPDQLDSPIIRLETRSLDTPIIELVEV